MPEMKGGMRQYGQLINRPIETIPVLGVSPTQLVTLKLVSRNAIDAVAVGTQEHVLGTTKRYM